MRTAMEQKKKSGIKRVLKRFFGTVVIIGVLSFGAWYYWQTQQELKDNDVAMRSLKYELRQDIEASHQTQYQDFLGLLMEPLGWAIRTELLSGNISTIHQYLAQFVKNPNIELIVLTDSDDSILSSSDKKIEGTNFAQVFPDISLKDNQTEVRAEENRFYVIHPVMGFDQRIGTIFLIYLSDDGTWLPNLLRN
jgi:hypothetical protein